MARRTKTEKLFMPDEPVIDDILDDSYDTLERILRLAKRQVKTVEVSKPIAAAGNYAAEDVVSESATAGTAWMFVGVGSGYITRAHALCEATALVWRLTLYLFTDVPTSALNDNGANTGPSFADLGKYVGKIDFPAMEDLGGMSETLATPNTVGNLPIAIDGENDSAPLYGILVTRDAEAGEAAGMDISIRLTVDRYYE